jgi:hypothetical protein
MIPRFNNINNNNKYVLSEEVLSGNDRQYIKQRFQFSFYGGKKEEAVH